MLKFLRRENKGITLVVLVITVIILLILAGITISQLTGHGLFSKAQEAKEKSKNAQIFENETLQGYEKLIDEFLQKDSKELDINIDLLKEIENSEDETKINVIVNSEEHMQKICLSEEMFTICANSKKIMEKICESSVARNSIYNNAEITESILANSSIALETMQESSQYEVANTTMTLDFSPVYLGKAFVLGVSQYWHNGSVAVTMTHGNYIIGNSTYTFGSGGTGCTYTGLGIRVNKFASSVIQKNSYGNGSLFYAAIFKID